MRERSEWITRVVAIRMAQFLKKYKLKETWENIPGMLQKSKCCYYL